MSDIPNLTDVMARMNSATHSQRPMPGETWRTKSGEVVTVESIDVRPTSSALVVRLPSGRTRFLCLDGREAIMGRLGQSPGDLMERLTT